MGNNNKNQQEKASALLATGKPKSLKKKKSNGMPTWVGTLILVSVLVALVLIAVFSALNAKGVFLHGKIVAKTENYEVNASMMSYVIYTEYQQFVSQNSSSSYNILEYIKGDGGTALNTSMGLRSQYYSKPTEEKPETEKITWFDYFANTAKASIEQVLTYCEIAKSEGMTLEDEDYAAIDSAISEIEFYAEAQGYKINDYLMSMYGKGVTAKEVRKMMELSQLASKVATERQEEIRNLVTDTRINEEYNKNQGDYDIYIGYSGYTFTATFEPKEGEDKDAAYEAYTAKQQLYRERIEILKSLTKKEDFANRILEWVYTDTKAEEKQKELDKGTAEAEAEKLAEERAQAASLEASNSATVDHYKKSEDSSDEAEKWLADNVRKVGDTTTFKTEGEALKTTEDPAAKEYNDKATSTYKAYLYTATPHVDNEQVVRSVGHILFKTETFKDMTDSDSLTGKVKELADRILDRGETISDESMAKELIALMKEEGKITEKVEGEKTYYVIDKDAFEEYGEIYTEDSNVFYEDVKIGDMQQEFEDWLFDDARKEGEISYPGAVKTEYGYHIMTYTGGEEKEWKNEIIEKLTTSDFESWYKAEAEKVTISFNDKALKSITG